MKKKLFILQELWTPFSCSRAGVYASAAGFYILLSASPAALLIIALLPVLSISYSTVISILSIVVPTSFLPLAETIIKYAYQKPSAGVLSVSTLITIWSASKGIGALLEGFRDVLALPKSSFLRRKIWRIALFLLLGPILITVVFLVAATHAVLRATVNALAPDSYVLHTIVRLRDFLSFLTLSVIFSLVYHFLIKTAKTTHVILVGMAVSASWIVLSDLFSLFSETASSYAVVGLIFSSMIWLRFIVLTLLYGAILCKLLSNNAYHPLQIIKNAFGQK